jgi:hypothetical protein
MRRRTTRFRSRTHLLRRPHREPEREVAEEEVDVSVYIERELECGRALFDVLGDPVVWTRVEYDDPFLLGRLAHRPSAVPSPQRPGEEIP